MLPPWRRQSLNEELYLRLFQALQLLSRRFDVRLRASPLGLSLARWAVTDIIEHQLSDIRKTKLMVWS